ncbi:14297_t:CDS:2 [Dentiscutata erythropus]|uniref:14297_t:CDS:1 n=1 Tax=Dentiscutata erythropus TaxID=1348616 RepID=A0A9N8VYN7_9GLOM|nr:14297_t:CDS:2 [Dentiscutata erythropus]
MGKPPHRSSFAEAEKNKFANTQELVRCHLKNCIYFKQKYNKSEQEEILEKSDKSVSVATTKIEEETDDNLKDFPRNILFNILNNEWWKSLMQLKDKGHLTEVLHSFGWVCQYKKVLAICQLRSELLCLRNITTIDKSLKTYKQKNGISPKNNEQISLEDNKEELSDNDIDNNIDNIEGQSQMNVEQLEIVRCVNLAEEEEGDYMQCDSFSLDKYKEEVMLQDNIHPANYLSAK